MNIEDELSKGGGCDLWRVDDCSLYRFQLVR
jgi:hypothetical protein